MAKGYEKAQQAVDMRQPYEQAVAPGKPADATLLAGYLAYVKLERTQGDPARVQVGAALAGACTRMALLHQAARA